MPYIIGCPTPAPTGHETKIFKNTAPAPSKRSHVERIVDKIILFMFFLLFSFCIVGAVFFAVWTKDEMSGHWYLAPEVTTDQYNPNNPAFVGFASFITSFILYGEPIWLGGARVTVSGYLGAWKLNDYAKRFMAGLSRCGRAFLHHCTT